MRAVPSSQRRERLLPRSPRSAQTDRLFFISFLQRLRRGKAPQLMGFTENLPVHALPIMGLISLAKLFTTNVASSQQKSSFSDSHCATATSFRGDEPAGSGPTSLPVALA